MTNCIAKRWSQRSGGEEMANNTYVELECTDGKKIKLTLAFYRLYQLKNINKKAYDDCNRIMTKGGEEILDNIKVLYTAYLCANIDNPEEKMSYEEFLMVMPNDWKEISRIAKELVGVKKKRDFGRNS